MGNFMYMFCIFKFGVVGLSNLLSEGKIHLLFHFFNKHEFNAHYVPGGTVLDSGFAKML